MTDFEILQSKYDKLESHCASVSNAVNLFIEGKTLSDDNTGIERKLKDFRESKAEVFASNAIDLPPLVVFPDGSSGIKIQCEFPEEYNCAEFTLRKGMQQVLISPWIQFKNSKMEDYRMKLATEIARRATAYGGMLEKLASMEYTLSTYQDASDKHLEAENNLKTAWANERQRYGLKKDFSDFNGEDWPK